MSDPTPVTHSVDAEGIGWLVFDDPTGRANVFNPATQAALRAAVTALAVQPLKAVIVLSAKEKIFIAGADLKWLATLPDAQAATQAARAGQELDRLASQQSGATRRGPTPPRRRGSRGTRATPSPRARGPFASRTPIALIPLSAT